jgi:hypothetical protein
MKDFFTENDTLRNAAFADFWELIPQGAKSGKAAAQKAFHRLSFDGQKRARDNVAAYYNWWRQRNPEASWLHPATYINQRRWQDEAFSGTTQTVDKAAFWAECINAGKYVSAVAISPSLCREMVERGLVTPEALTERGLA